jgi:hypothetical protein
MTIARFLPLLLLLVPGQAPAQGICEPIAKRCEKHLTENYIPDGQFYRALLNQDEVAEFDLTLFGGTTYRVAACSGEEDGLLVFSVYDRERNLLYTNASHRNEPFWDLAVSNTIDVVLEANLDNTKAGSGCAVMLIGFRN